MAHEAVQIYELLREEGLEAFYIPFQVRLHVKRTQDFKNVTRTDLSRIGIVSGPDLKRFAKVVEKTSKSNVLRDKLHKVFKPRPKVSHLPHFAAVLQTEPVIIKVGDISLGNELGRGQFGTVNEALWNRRIDGETVQIPVAVKSLGGSFGFNEVSNLTSLDQNHENIIKFFGIIVDGDAPFKMVTEFASLGSLLSRLESGDIRSVSMLSQFAVQIASGMLYLESKNLVHRDLAARNILVMAYNQIKISDFGLSKLLNQNKEWIMKVEEVLPIRWLAPECVLEGKFTTASDVWSYGVTLWEMYNFGQIPWEGLSSKETIEKITSGVHLEEPVYCPRYFYSFILDKCWQQKAEDRSSFEQIQERMTWLQPMTCVASSSCHEAEMLEFQANDLITAVKPCGGDDDFWIGQNETSGDIGIFRKSHTRPMLGKGFTSIQDEVYRKLKPDSEKMLDKDEEEEPICDHNFAEKRKRTQSQHLNQEHLKEVNQHRRPLSDGLLLEKLQQMVESGYYDVPRSVFDDEDDYVTMKEYLEDDTLSRTQGLRPHQSRAENLHNGRLSLTNKSCAIISDASRTEIARKPVPPPKPKRLLNVLHNEISPPSTHAATIATQTSLDFSSRTHDLGPRTEDKKNGLTECASFYLNDHSSDLDGSQMAFMSSEKTFQEPKGEDIENKHSANYNYVRAEVTEGYAKTAVVVQGESLPPPKPKRSFSRIGLESMMSALNVGGKTAYTADEELQKNYDTFKKRVSPHSTMNSDEELQNRLESYVKEGWYQVPRPAEVTVIVSQQENSKDEKSVTVNKIFTAQDSESGNHSSDDDYESIPSDDVNEISDYAQESGRYDAPRLYEKNVEDPNKGYLDVSTPTSNIGKEIDNFSDGKEGNLYRKSASEGRLAHPVPNYLNSPDALEKAHTKTCGLLASYEASQIKHAKSELSLLNPDKTSGVQARSLEAIVDYKTMAEAKSSLAGEMGYQSYSSLYQRPGNGNEDWIPGKSSSFSSHSKRGFLAKLTRPKSIEEKTPELTYGGWEPDIPKPTATKEITHRHGLKLPLTKKRSKKLSEGSSSGRNTPTLTVEQIPKFLNWIHINLPELSGTSHSELFGALELTRGNLEETIHYLKYRRLLDCGIPLTAEMALDALEQCKWDIKESLACAALMYVVYKFPDVDVDHCRHLLLTCNWSPESLIRKLTMDVFVHQCEEIGVTEEQAHFALRFAEGDTERAIQTMKARRASEIVGKSEEFARDILAKFEWDIDQAIVYILNTS